jgi:hypothetical protein
MQLEKFGGKLPVTFAVGNKHETRIENKSKLQDTPTNSFTH